MHKVSVIIPAFLPTEEYINYLKSGVDSVKNQSYSNVDITIVFNGPINIDIENAKCIKIPFKTSASIARNIGASFNLNSDYFCFLDADDMFHEHKIKEQLNVCVEENIDFCFTERYDIDSSGNILEKFNYINSAHSNDEIKNIISIENVLPTSSCMIKVEPFFKCGMFAATNEYKIKGPKLHMNTNESIYEDYLLWINAINKDYKFKKLINPLTYYRINTSVAR